MKNKILTSLFGVLLAGLCISPVLVYAQGAPTGPGTSEKQPLVTCGDKKDCTVEDFFKTTQSITNLMFMFAGFVVAVMFMYAGFLLITSVGDVSQIQKAKSVFRRTVVGFVIMFLAYITVKTLVLKFNLTEDAQKILIKLFGN